MLGGITMSIEPLDADETRREPRAVAVAHQARIERAADRRDGRGA